MCPIRPRRNHLINSQALKQMKPTAYLINTSRGRPDRRGSVVDRDQGKTELPERRSMFFEPEAARFKRNRCTATNE